MTKKKYLGLLAGLLFWQLLLGAVLNHSIWDSYASRNGAGTYSIPNTFTAGTTITASSHNANFADIATELTNSVAADGQTSMTGPLKAANGSAAAPSLTFASDTDTGLYRKAANQIGIGAAGAEIGYFDANGLTLSSGATVPPGTFFPYAGTTAPTGYLLAFGQCVSRTTYAALFAVLSTTFDNSCAGTDFGIPDLRGRAVFGVDAMGGTPANRMVSGTLGVVGGAAEVTLLTGNLPSHTHTGTVDSGGVDHNHGLTILGGSNLQGSQTGRYAWASANPANDTYATANSSAYLHTHTFTTGATGSGTAVNKVPPAILLNYIIKI